ncbi:uncharacterized protein CLUP02_10544 [Colletotrichum lupini]|uniref:Uncharacterized protein n=1 Tax=Colletotrichum lupini TaxID=145971 RepID=A0A9Q8SWZ5_9PEZI|nr:uncharacterized protein CLUP02_10544 [Colletotrichum lupini]UQC85048.1 hypothetical protein CLUP02_10544 [Colletotrichum lupini]
METGIFLCNSYYEPMNGKQQPALARGNAKISVSEEFGVMEAPPRTYAQYGYGPKVRRSRGRHTLVVVALID